MSRSVDVQLFASGGRATLPGPILKARGLDVNVRLVHAVDRRLEVLHLRRHVLQMVVLHFQTGLLLQLLSRLDLV